MLLAVVGTIAVGCLPGAAGPAAPSVPPGAPVIQVSVKDSAVRIAPGTVRSGPVYLSVRSDGAELIFIGGGAADAPGPVGLTDEHLAAVLHGDLLGTYQASGFPSGEAAAVAFELGDLPPGKYLFLPAGVVTLEPGGYEEIPGGSFAVLEVLP